MFDRVPKIDKIFRRYPQAPLFARLADDCLRRGRLLRAQALCVEGCKRFPDYPTGFFLLSRCYEQQKMWEEAREALDRGLRLDPDNPSGYQRLARVYRRLRNDTLALKCLEQAAALDPLSKSLRHELEQMSLAVRRAPSGDEEPEGPRSALPSAAADTVVEEPAPAPEPAEEATPQPTSALAPAPEAEPLDDSPRGSIDDEVESLTEATPANAEQEQEEQQEEDEPFGRVQPQPEWVVAPATEDFGLMEDDEVAALGAGLFEDETPTRPARKAKPAVLTPPVAVPPQATATASPDVETSAGAHQGLDESSLAPEPPASQQHRVGAVPPMAAAAEAERHEPEIDQQEAVEPDAAAVTPGVAQLAGRRGSELAEVLREFDAGPARPGEGTEPGRGTPVATITLAEIYVGQGYPEQALEIYQRVLRADPDNETAKRGAAELR